MPKSYKVYDAREDYHPTVVAQWLKEEKELFDSLGASETFFRRMYQDNYLEFIGK